MLHCCSGPKSPAGTKSAELGGGPLCRGARISPCFWLSRHGDPARVLAGTDCGVDTGAGASRVAENIVWSKLAALSDGARRASQRLFLSAPSPFSHPALSAFSESPATVAGIDRR